MELVEEGHGLRARGLKAQTLPAEARITTPSIAMMVYLQIRDVAERAERTGIEVSKIIFENSSFFKQRKR